MTLRPKVRRTGRIDALGDLRDWDLTAFHQGASPWMEGYLRSGFLLPAGHYRRRVRNWGFSGLGRIADLGSGFGLFSLFLAEVNPEVTGYDFKADAAALSRRIADFAGLPNARFQRADLAALPAEDGAFDGAWLNNTLQVVDRAKTMIEAHRILRPGGLLFVGEYRGPGRLVEMFQLGYRRNGAADLHASAAISALRLGPRHDGENTYADMDELTPMLARFGFRLSERHRVASERLRSRARAHPFADALGDLPALADRLEADPRFAHRFARRRGAASGLLYRLSFCAVRV